MTLGGGAGRPGRDRRLLARRRAGRPGARHRRAGAPTWTQVAWHVVRAVALAMGAGLGGFALTMVFRHTVATLALLFVYSIGGEIAVNLLPVEGAGRWSVGNNALGWLAIRHRYFDATIDCAPGERLQLDADDDPPRGGHLPRRPLLVARVLVSLRAGSAAATSEAPDAGRGRRFGIRAPLRRTVAGVTQAPNSLPPPPPGPRGPRTQAPPPRGPQRRDPDRAQARVDQDAGEDGPRVHRSCRSW